jgi:ABC-2 type transport system permease protein
VDVAAGIAIFAAAFRRMGRWPSSGEVTGAILLLGGAVLILYALWILVVSAAFYVVKIDNLSYLFTSIFDAARWPVSVFRGPLRLVFTFVIPLALMTTYPALALLGRLDPIHGLEALVGALAFAAFARLVWVRSVARYTSASS